VRAKRAVLACGGTGGHFYPGLVLGQALKQRGWEPLFVLRRDDPASSVLNAADLPFVELDLTGMPRGFSPRWPAFGLRLFKSLISANAVLRSFHPDCAVGMGAYITFPVIIAAWRRKIPAMIHESNSAFGLANRACLPFVSKAALGLPGSETARRPGRVRYELTGTPVRPELLRLPAGNEARRALGLSPELPTLLAFGGSQGARGINRVLPQALRELAERRPDSFQCLHLTGPAEEGEVRAAYEGARMRAVVKPYLQEMHLAYGAADLVVCRSGASTIAELCATRKPAILIPFPSAAAGHQEDNARVLTRIGAAQMIREKDAGAHLLAAAVEAGLFSAGFHGRYEELGLPEPPDTIAALVRMVESLTL